ncbi:hypothetical protein HCJ76_44070 [Streptomyces sp. MC1]|uniref:hypothetical protein n=1 Tax=Streptomyces sp. MC1 TaxID=295105 RepID=UPI0018CBDC18|nr:hypothetical protein [Streptomyces sp. MC1]MBG7704861.1 hypothetical protein [Streptomyces sp. MC1]
MNARATRAALATYARKCGRGEQAEPKHWQASDLMTDLLLSFDAETAEQILHRARRDYDAEQSTATPQFPPAD